MSSTPYSRYVVLYADDDEDDLELVSEAFSQFGSEIELVTAMDGLEAISYLNNLPPEHPAPCLIILDINMPRLDGREVFRKIRQMDRFTKTPVVFFTTSNFDGDKSYALQNNAGLITKPLDMRQMSQIAETFVRYCTEDVQEILRKIAQD